MSGIGEKKPPKRPKIISAEDKGQYQLKRLLGEGGFGCVYEAEHLETGERVAVKLELKDHDAQLRSPHKKIQLQKEAEMYTKLVGTKGLPKLHWFGSQGQWAVMVMELLGTSLFELHRFCNHRFSLKTILMLADQMLSQIEFLHQQGIIHNDIKPENFCMGSTDETVATMYTIDFGLSVQLVKDAQTGNYQWQANGSSTLCGTRSFMSIRSHQGNYRSFRDDLEGIAYVLIFLACGGRLPWQKAGCDKKIHEVKSKTTVEDLCADLPEEFGRYCKYTRQLPYHEVPNYSLCRKLFQDLFKSRGFSNDGIYDWHLRAQDNESKFQGWLFHMSKKDAGTLTETEVWNRRLCLIDVENKQALLFKSEEHMRKKFKIETRIKLDRATVIFTEDSKHENTAFQIHIPAVEKPKTRDELRAEGKGRPKTAKEREQEQSEAEMKKQLFGDGSENYYLQANTMAEVDEWLVQLESAGAKQKVRRVKKLAPGVTRGVSGRFSVDDGDADGERRRRSAPRLDEDDHSRRRGSTRREDSSDCERQPGWAVGGSEGAGHNASAGSAEPAEDFGRKSANSKSASSTLPISPANGLAAGPASKLEMPADVDDRRASALSNITPTRQSPDNSRRSSASNRRSEDTNGVGPKKKGGKIKISDPKTQLSEGCTLWHPKRGYGVLNKIDPANVRNRPYQVSYEDAKDSHQYSVDSVIKKIMLIETDMSRLKMTAVTPPSDSSERRGSSGSVDLNFEADSSNRRSSTMGFGEFKHLLEDDEIDEVAEEPKKEKKKDKKEKKEKEKTDKADEKTSRKDKSAAKSSEPSKEASSEQALKVALKSRKASAQGL